LCLAVPYVLVDIRGKEAVAERGGLRVSIRLDLLEEARVGDKVLVHAGFAIERLKEEEAEEIEALWRELGLGDG